MSLIENDVLEGYFAETVEVADEQLVVREQYLELGHL